MTLPSNAAGRTEYNARQGVRAAHCSLIATGMMMNKAEDLRGRYEDVCQAYADALNEMWGTDGYWIDDDQCFFDVADCVIGIEEVRLIVDNRIHWDTFIEWYDYDMQIYYAREHGKKVERINLYSWWKGYPDDLKVSKEVRDAWEKEYWDKL